MGAKRTRTSREQLNKAVSNVPDQQENEPGAHGERERALGEAARNAAMYLATGFITCPRCGKEVETKDTDAEYTLRAALSSQEPSAHRETVLYKAGRKTQKAIAAILASGGLESDKWWDDLVSAQQSLAAAIRALHPQADKPSDDGAQGEGWLDINDAPQDGTIVDLWCDRLSKRVPNCRWNPDFNIGYPEDGPGFWEHLEGNEWRPSYDERWFSHYRTIPTPPAGEVV